MQRYKENSKVNEIYAKLHFFEDKTNYNANPNPTLKGTALMSEPNICVSPKRPKRTISWNFKVVKTLTPNGL